MLPMIYMSLVDDDDLPRFEEIYTKYRQMLYGVAYRILNNEHDAEEAVITTYERIAEKFKEISDYLKRSKQKYFFTKWNKVDLTKELNAKISQEVYA